MRINSHTGRKHDWGVELENIGCEIDKGEGPESFNDGECRDEVKKFILL